MEQPKIAKKSYKRDDQIAQIYEQLEKGDQSAKNKLNTNQQLTHQSEISQEILKNNNNDNFRKYLKEKVTQLRKQKDTINQIHQYQSVDIIPKKQYTQSKPFQNHTIQHRQQQIKQEKVSINNIPNQPKSTTKDHFKNQLNKNIIKDQPHITPPSSKKSFRIKNGPSISKKLRQQLIKLNQDQKKIQRDIINLHNQSKEELEYIKNKYHLKAKQQGKSKTVKNQINQITLPDQQISPLKKQKIKSELLYKQLDSINQNIKQTKQLVGQLQNRSKNSILNQYLYNQDDIFEARQSQQQADNVEQLPNNQENKEKNMGKTYRDLMKQMKNKKWGLSQRLQYDLQKIITPNIKNNQKNVISTKQQDIDNDNKVVVNSRLKNLLFD